MSGVSRRAVKVIMVLLPALIISCSSQTRFSEPSVRQSEPAVAGVWEQHSFSDTLRMEPTDSSLLEYLYIDDEMRYQLDLAEENYKMGYSATLDSNWLEAQFYFETALEILAGLDVDLENSTLGAEFYVRLTNEIISDYKRALLHIATLPSESSPSAVIARFEELSELTAGDSAVAEGRDPKPDTVVFDIPIVWNTRVENCINFFQTVGREPFERSLARSGKYIPLMEKILAEEGLPHDLVYLPLIESGFNPRAYSWAHAVGPWQFISGTGHLYGLKRSWWYDDRRDFEKSTRAAARHLRDLYAQTNDWYLALLGYNAGIGNVRKVIERNKTRDYFKMNIRNSQMRNYVPLYLAATIIAKQPEKYGFQIEYEAPIRFDTVTIDRCLALEDIAGAIGCTYSELQDLNPALLRKYTPPDVKDYVLRIPRGKTAAFLVACPTLESPEETSWVQHTVRRGETVSGIARRYGVSQFAVIDANNLKRPYRIGIGQVLVVPVPLGEARSYSGGGSRSYSLTDGRYIVRRGDNLSGIASAFGTTADKLCSLNNIPKNRTIHPGQKLRIPGVSESAYSGSHGGGKSSSGTVSYRVRKGDTLWDLARVHGTTVSRLRSLNGMSQRQNLREGQVIKLPGSTKSSAPSAYYVVKRGDTLSSIARIFGVSMNNLLAWNNISNPHSIPVGKRLRVSGE